MSFRSRVIISASALFFILLALIGLIHNVQKNNQDMIQNENRLIISSALILDPHTNLRLVVDHNPQTAILNLNHLTTRAYENFKDPSPNYKQWPFRLDLPFIQLDVGLSHFPGNPPLINPLTVFRIWPGNQKNPEDWRAWARPKKIRLIFFRQRLVDADREYKLIGEPVLWQIFEFDLKDVFGHQDFALNFRDKILSSEEFPGQIDFLWCRLEILGFYQGEKSRTKKSIAISELEFLFKRKYRNTVSTQSTL